MNEAELAELTAELPEQFVGRVSDSTLEILRSYADAGEWGELLTLLTAGLKKTRAQLSRQELDQLRTVFTGWEMPTEMLADLNIAD